MPEQCIGRTFSLDELGVSPEEWDALSIRLQPPGTFDFDESVLTETISSGNRNIAAAALLFASEFERYKGRDSRIFEHLFKAVEILPANTATLRALVDELEAFHRPAEAVPYADRLVRIIKSGDPGCQPEADLWKWGHIKYLAGDKEEAITYWRTLPLYQRLGGEELLTRRIEGCERRLAQYEQYRRDRGESRTQSGSD